MSRPGFPPALLSALFHPDLTGAVFVAADEIEQEVTSAAEIAAFAETHADAKLLLTTDRPQSGSCHDASAFAVFDDEDPLDPADVAYRLVKPQTGDVINLRLAAPHDSNNNTNDCIFYEIPVPGFGGWEIDAESLAKLDDGLIADLSETLVLDAAAPAEDAHQPVDAETVRAEVAHQAVDDQPVPAETSAAAPAVPVDGIDAPAAAPVALHDAVFPYGLPSDEVMSLKMTLGFGKSRDEKRWVARDRRWGDIIHLISEHKEGHKDGPAFLQGSAIGNQRLAKAMSSMFMVGLDVDCGISVEWAIERIRKLNLAAILYTTHSHLKPLTSVNQTSFAQWAKKNGVAMTEPTDDDMRRYLRTARGWSDDIAASAKILGKKHEADGVAFQVEHVPMPKFRVVFPLDRAYTFIEQKGLLHVEAINRWKGKLLGLARIVGVPIDESCLDPSRLFYLPRHPADAPSYAIIGLPGAPLEFDAVPDASPRNEEQLADDAFAAAARELGATSAPLMFGDFSLKRWAMRRAGTFLPAELIRSLAPDRIRMDQQTSKMEIECPFDHEHSNAGDPYDRAAFVIDAHADGNTNSFSWGCQHNCCRSRDRLEFVGEALKAGWFSPEDLDNETYLCLTADEDVRMVDPERLAQDLYQRAQVIEKGSLDSIAEGEMIIKEAVKGRLASGRLDLIIQTVCAATGQKKKALSDVAKDFQRQIALSEKDGDKLSRVLQDWRIDAAGREPFLIDAGIGYSEQYKILADALLRFNRRTPTVFTYGDSRTLVHFDENAGKTFVEPLDWLGLTAVLAKILFIKLTENGASTIPLPDRVLKELVAAKSWPTPELIGFATLPYYRASGALVTRAGYDSESCLYLKPALRDQFDVPTNPTPTQIEAARAFIMDTVYGEFPFDDGPEFQDTRGAGSRAHFVAFLLQPFIRAMVNGPTPIYLVSKPTAGTGASLLIRTALMINSGRARPDSNTESSNEEETRKNITSAFRSGQTFYWIDNVNHDIRSTSYCNLATAAQWQDRVLGKSDLVSFPNKMQFIMSGNNPKGSYEVMRRCLPIRLDARTDPRSRENWKIDDLDAYVLEHRKQLVEALLTMVNAWLAAGRPPFSGKPLMSFESWSRITGGILQNAGIEGFLSNMHLTQKFADDETRNWETFMQAWIDDKKGGLNSSRMINDLADMLIEMADFPPIVRYVDDAKMMAPRLRAALDSKIGAPYSVYLTTRTGGTTEDGRPEEVSERVIVTISRGRTGKGPMEYQIKRMED